MSDKALTVSIPLTAFEHLTPTAIKLLAHIRHLVPPGKWTVLTNNTLAESAHLSPTHVPKTLQQLEAHNYIQRRVAKTDTQNYVKEIYWSWGNL